MEKSFILQIQQELLKRFRQYQALGEQCILQLDEADLHYQPNTATNSIAVIVQHVHGNMMSRFTDFLTSDGEKPWRKRDEEFLPNTNEKNKILAQWHEGWQLLLQTLEGLRAEDFLKNVSIRNEPLSVTDALFRQLAHYAYHTGQIIHIAKSLRGEQWRSLSIPPGQSEQYNQSEGIKDPANQFKPK